MKMINVSNKEITEREAIAEGKVCMKPTIILAIKEGKVPKGDVLAASKIAGIIAAKETPLLIPLCHPIPIDYINIEFYLGEKDITIKTVVKGKAKTGFEMEALTASAIAALTIYDMCKPLDKEIVISEIKLTKKSGGKSGIYIRDE